MLDLTKSITVSKTAIHINTVTIHNPEIADFFLAIPEPQHEQTLSEAIKFGVEFLKRMQAGAQIDYVNRELDRLFLQMHNKIEDGIVAKLDPNRKDSIQATLTAAVDSVIRENGPFDKTLRATIHAVVPQLLAPFHEEMRNRMNDLCQQITTDEATKNALKNTTHKGLEYEDQVVGELQAWSRGHGFDIHHVGRDARPGDVLVVCTDGDDFRVVVEAKDKADGAARKRISDELQKAIRERDADAAIYVSKTSAGLGKETRPAFAKPAHGVPAIMTCSRLLSGNCA
jgi:hypothetical protein